MRDVIASQAATTADRRGVNDRPVYIVDGSRTPFLKARGVGTD
jgi:hypothetical protein